jgi:hypothetical protein
MRCRYECAIPRSANPIIFSGRALIGVLISASEVFPAADGIVYVFKTVLSSTSHLGLVAEVKTTNG